MAKPMTAFTTDLQHSGMIAKDLDETIKFYREVMGFELAGLFMNGENRCAFLRYGHLTIKPGKATPPRSTSRRPINLLGFRPPRTYRTSALRERQALGVDFKDTEIQSIPSFWKHGIRYFNIYGPNGETIEFCQIVEE